MEKMNVNFYRIFGNAFELLSFSQYHKEMKIYYLQRNIYPPAFLNQLVVYYDSRGYPWGFFSWATVSSKIELILKTTEYSLSQSEWTCGERVFINDFVSPWGGTKFIINDIKERVFPYKSVASAIRRRTFKSSKNASFHQFVSIKIPQELEANIEQIISHGKYLTSEEKLNLLSLIISGIDEFKSEFEICMLLDEYDVTARDNFNIVYSLCLKIKEKLFNEIAPLECDLGRHVKLKFSHYGNYDFLLSNRIPGNYYDFVLKNPYPYVYYLPFIGGGDIYCKYDFSFEKVLKIIKDAFKNFFPSFEKIIDLTVENTFFDIRDTIDKISKPFMLSRGMKLPLFISSPYNGDARSIISLVHEFSHALLFFFNKECIGYIYVEDRPLVNEIFAFLGERIFCEYIKSRDYPFNDDILKLEEELDRYYILFSPIIPLNVTSGYLCNYNINYPYARSLSRELMNNYPYEYDRLSNHIEGIFKDSIKLDTDVLLDKLTDY